MEKLFRFYIYGAGRSAVNRYEKLVSVIIDLFPMELIGFIDKDERKRGETLFGRPIFTPDILREKGYDAVYVLLSDDYYRDAYTELILKYNLSTDKLGGIADLIETAQALFSKRCMRKQTRIPQIYDCFTFYNELEVLEIRLETLDPYVDKFVLVEMEKDHHGRNKPYFFEENRDRFKKYLNKITVIHPKELPEYIATDEWNWTLERFQRECIKYGLTDAEPEDYIMISDCDEIPNTELLKDIKKHYFTQCQTTLTKVLERTSVALKMDYHYFYFNYRMNQRSNTTTITKYRNLISPTVIRDMINYLPYIDQGGWHLTYFGGADRVKTKMASIVEGEDIREEDIEYRIKNGIDIYDRKADQFLMTYLMEDEMTFPNVRKWRERFPNLWLEVDG